MSAWIVQQRRPSSALPMVRQWSECAGSYSEDGLAMIPEVRWWTGYDDAYCLAGWEYQVVETKRRKG